MTRDLRLLCTAIALSSAGDMLLMVVLALRVHELTGSGLAVSGLFVALMVPVVVLAPWAGRLVDRVETRRVLLLVSVAQVAVAGALVFAATLICPEPTGGWRRRDTRASPPARCSRAS